MLDRDAGNVIFKLVKLQKCLAKVKKLRRYIKKMIVILIEFVNYQ